MMRRPAIAQAIFGGFVGTIIFLLVLYWAPLINWPRVDYAGLIANLFGSTWDLGLLAELALGVIVFPLLLIYYFWGVLPGPALVKGIAWSLLLWLVSEVAFMPATRGGLFSSRLDQPVLAVVAAAIAHLIYGICLGGACTEVFFAMIPGVDGEQSPTPQTTPQTTPQKR